MPLYDITYEKVGKLAFKATHCYKTYYPDPPGGLQEAVRQICLGTTEFGVSNTVFALSPEPYPKEIQYSECRVVRCRSYCSPASCDLGSVDSLRTFSRLSAESDILHYQFPWPFADVLHLAVRKKIPSIITYQSDIVRQKILGSLYYPLMWKMLTKMKFIVATSSAYVNSSSILSHPDIRERVRVIPLGIDEKSYPSAGDEKILHRLGIFGAPYFLFIGVLRYYKGLHTLILAASKIDAKIVIAGDGPRAIKIKEMVRQLGCNNVIFAGYVTNCEKVSLIKGCRALILPSHLRSEAYGMVLVEGAMFGRPLISCEIGTGTSYVNAHQESGLVIAPEDTAGLAHSANLLLQEEAIFNALAQGARKRYEQLFSGSAMGRAYFELYQEAVR